MESRKCRHCDVVKPINEFANAGVVKGVKYWRRLCIPCYSISKQPRKKRMREAYYELKKSYKCGECGNPDFRVLDFDHLDRKTKSFDLGMAIGRGYSLEKIKAEMDKCQVLCSNCHRIKTWEEGIGV